MINHPDRFLSISKTLHRFGIIDKSILRFAEYQMNTTEKRERVYYSWVVFRKLRFDIASLATLANQHAIPVTIIVGKYDKVIPPASMNTSGTCPAYLSVKKLSRQYLKKTLPFLQNACIFAGSNPSLIQ